jgi:hypothetical protein
MEQIEGHTQQLEGLTPAPYLTLCPHVWLWFRLTLVGLVKPNARLPPGSYVVHLYNLTPVYITVFM